MIIERLSWSNDGSRTPDGTWWVGLAEIAHEAPDFCDLGVDLTKGYGMDSITLWNICNPWGSVEVRHGLDAEWGTNMRLREAS